ncbi:hypothetical protein C8F04DRAFT_1270369 [Mycena alexandri]|uniref:Transmembrane protein n=1 Tax=Mycena alexandri TaxID=1745969 RepID=A0AAD6WTH1_9AGAR|nr:hypothetical protein C8F04DRAFT_1270369 [Mycena alexandri]
MSLWNLTIDDTSPFFTYFPYADGSNSGLTKGWTPWYAQSGFITTNGEGGDGDSYHITSLPGASVNLTFHVTAVYLYGQTNSCYDTTVDNQPYTHDVPTSDLLLAVSDLKEGTHSVALFARPSSSSQQLAFDRAVISTPFVNNQIPAELFYDNTDTTMFKYTGKWASATAPGIPNSTVTHPWEETFTLGAYVELDIDIGAVGVSLWGMTNWGNWLYSVVREPAWLFFNSSPIRLQTLDGVVNQYNGSTFWKVPDAMLFYGGGLDPTKTHKLAITNESSMKLALNSLRVYNISVAQDIATAPGTSSEPIPGTGSAPIPATGSASASTRYATGLGPIVAVVVLGLAGSILWWRFRNRLQTPSHDMGQISISTGHPEQTQQTPSNGYPVKLTGYQVTTPTSPPTSPGGSVSKTRVSGPPGATTATPRLSVTSYQVNRNPISPVVDPSSTYSASQDRGMAMARSSSHPTQPSGSNGLDETIAPSNSPSPQPLVSNALETSDLDRLVELIAQRIDRGPRSNDDASPPEYRG